MMLRRKPRSSEESLVPPAGDIDAILQIKVWLLGINPMVWRRVLVPSGSTLRELHGVLQVAMGWEGIHLYQFSLRAARYGSWELSASSPEVTLAALRLRKGVRFLYEYDLNIPWCHEVRIEDRVKRTEVKSALACIGGDGACPPEDCSGPAGFMSRRDELLSHEGIEDLRTMAEILDQVVSQRRPEILDDEDTRWELERAMDRSRSRQRAQGQPFSRRVVNAGFRQGRHRELMHQQM